MVEESKGAKDEAGGVDTNTGVHCYSSPKEERPTRVCMPNTKLFSELK